MRQVGRNAVLALLVALMALLAGANTQCALSGSGSGTGTIMTTGASTGTVVNGMGGGGIAY